MVWKERVVTIPVESDGLMLEGVWQAGTKRGAVIAPPHPLYGGSLDHPVVNELAYTLYREGFASVRFNWRGVGASQGVPSGDRGDAERDFRAALDHLHQSAPSPLLGAGYSFGAATALRVALVDARIQELLLVAPPGDMIRALQIETFQGPIHVIAGGQDVFARADELSSLLASLPNARLDVIPEADHFFTSKGLGSLSQLVRAAVA